MSNNTLLLITGAMCLLAATSAEVEDIVVFFPDISDDLSKVTWGHAVNSKDHLEECIQDGDLAMIEADVNQGHLINQLPSDPVIPIMAHPPVIKSDISLELWLNRVILANKHGKKKGAKLDFKNLNILEESLQILKNNIKEINFPLWLNADILQGPGSHKQPIDANKFIHLCSEYFPLATLSVGWTTQYIPEGAYTQKMVEDMKQVLTDNNINQTVTFPIRAAFVLNSLDTLEWLLDNTHESSSTITVWSSASDSVNMSALLMLRDRVGHDVVYYDLPGDQQNNFDNLKNSGNLSTFIGIHFHLLYLCISIIGN